MLRSLCETEWFPVLAVTVALSAFLVVIIALSPSQADDPTRRVIRWQDGKVEFRHPAPGVCVHAEEFSWPLSAPDTVRVFYATLDGEGYRWCVGMTREMG